MALALQAPVQPLAKLSLPLGIILLGTAAQVIGQFQTLVRREAVHRALQFCNAHASIYTQGEGHFKTYLDVSPAKPAALINIGASARRWGRTESFQAFQRLRWAPRLGSVDEIVPGLIPPPATRSASTPSGVISTSPSAPPNRHLTPSCGTRVTTTPPCRTQVIIPPNSEPSFHCCAPDVRS